MPIYSTSARPIPTETQRAARASFGRHTFYVEVGDQLAGLLDGREPQEIAAEQNGEQLNGLSVVTVFQFLEGLHDMQAVEATRTRVDWKYALHLPLNYPGFAVHRLCRERYRLREQLPEPARFENLVASLAQIYQPERDAGIFPAGKVLLQQVCTSSRLQAVLEAMHMALEVLASRHPEWLREVSLPHWYERYRPNATWEQQLGSSDPVTCADLIGMDIRYVLERIAPQSLPGMRSLEEVQHLQHIFAQQYHTGNGTPQWRRTRCANCKDGGLYQH